MEVNEAKYYEHLGIILDNYLILYMINYIRELHCELKLSLSDM